MFDSSVEHIQEVMRNTDGVAPSQGVFVFGMHKGGSTMLHKFTNLYTKKAGIKSISIGGELFGIGVGDHAFTQNRGLSGLLNEKFVFYGFRYVPAFMLLDKSRFLNSRAVLLIRDPRDCVVSAYYSFRKSHVVLSESDTDAAQQVLRERRIHQQTSIDDYARSEMHRFVEELTHYAYFAHENLKVFRYEEVVFAKEPFFKEVIAHLELPFDKDAFASALTEIDVIPTEERQNEHIRQVVPGDHRNKLKPATIETLNSRFEQVLKLYGYL